ncbi:Uncharacterised protein [Tyzzerella nexilis]|uniref:Uncharacterized protein n=1 Tax=[Clostridium] nexile TaxID=29361 RepID=A0A6N2VR21_9FIRM
MKKIVEERLERMKPLAKERGFFLEYGEKIENHCVFSGIIIKDENKKTNIFPCVYYEAYWDELSDIELLEEMIQFTRNAPEIDTKIFFNEEYFSEHVFPMILDLDNEETIRELDIIYRKTDCFLILFYLRVSEEGIMKITNSFFERIAVTEEDKVKLAFANAEKNLVVQTIEEVISEILETPFLENGVERFEKQIYVVSNRKKQYGASAIILPKTYEILREYLGDRFIILPSSLHECIAVSYEENQLEELVDIVRCVNCEVVEDVDKLSDHIYLCDKTGISLLR